MKQVIGLRFAPNTPVWYFEKGQEEYRLGDKVIVQQSEYEEIAEVVVAFKECGEEENVKSRKLLLRKADAKDWKQAAENEQDAKQAVLICKKKVQELHLDMKILEAQYSFDRKKLTFLFSSEGRVDFRTLVRELAALFRVRIELRQVGARDEAKILGGIGPCGRPLCCSTFLGDFVPVSIKMAKDQGLSLNTAKISGLCGRLMCCLNYENETYEEIRKSMPDYGTKLLTPDGFGKVVGLNMLAQIVSVRLAEQKKVVDYTWEELQETIALHP